MSDDARARAAADDVTMHKVNALLGHWMGGINPCICTRCKDVAAYVADVTAQAVRAERMKHTGSEGSHGLCIACEQALRAPGQP